MDRSAFERLVEEAIRGLPQEFQEKLQNVAVIVEDYPSDDLMERLELDDDDTLLGLYEGTPLPDRGYETPLHPDRIWIFQEAIQDMCDTEEEIRREVQTTIVHEVGHYFGLSDDYLHSIGY